MDCSLQDSSVLEIFQARVAISFSKGSSQPRDQTGSPTLQAGTLPSEPPGKPWFCLYNRLQMSRRPYFMLFNVILGFPDISVGKESACNAGNPSSIPGLGRFTGEGMGYPPQYSGLENFMDYVVHGAAESLT